MPLQQGAWRMPPPTKGYAAPWMLKLSTRLAVASFGLFSKFWIQWLNKTRVHNKEILHEIYDKPRERGLLTISNHTSCVDDPLIWGGLLTTKQLLNVDKMRFTSGASDVCFTKNFYSLFFSLGKVFPVVRGDGVYQKGMDFTVDQLNCGNWCHIFPEGKLNVDHEEMRLKWGVGRLIADCEKPPIVLPVWHVGMDSILPNVRPYIPQIRKRVTLYIGEPLDFTADLELLRSLKKTPRETRKYITDKIQEEFKTLKVVAEALHREFSPS